MPKRIQHKLPKIGTTFERNWHGKTYRLQIIGEPGKIGYKVQGRTFASPSGAAKSITKQEVNGWSFWHID